MSLSPGTIWAIIAAVGVGTFLLRFSFLGLVGGRRLPDWALRLLRYTPVAVIPGLMAPQIVQPAAGGTAPDPVTLLVAGVVIAVGAFGRNAIWAMLAGAATLALATLALR